MYWEDNPCWDRNYFKNDVKESIYCNWDLAFFYHKGLKTENFYKIEEFNYSEVQFSEYYQIEIIFNIQIDDLFKGKHKRSNTCLKNQLSEALKFCSTRYNY